MTVFRTIFFALALFPSYLWGQHQQTDGLNNIQLRKQLRGAERARDYYSQIDYLEALVQRKPNKLNYKYKLARAYDESRNYQRALEEYSKVYYADQEKYAVALFHMGRIMKMREQYEMALLYFNRFKDNHNRSKEALWDKKLVKAEIAGCEMALQKDLNDNPTATVKPLAGDINKGNIEFSPRFVRHNTFWYVSVPTDEIVFLEADSVPLRRIYQAEKINGEWHNTSLVNHPANSQKRHIGSFDLSADGRRMYFTLCKPNWQNRMVCKIYMSVKEGEWWSQPEILPQEINDNKHTFTQPCVGASSKKGREIIYFVSDKKGGKGGYDIWYTRYRIDKHRFEKARNAGSKINSKGDELTPSFDYKTHRLYFASNGLPSLGGFDIFETIGERSKWMYPAKNAGKQINSSYDDLYYVPHPIEREKALLVSNREGSIALKHNHCCDDIFELKWKNLTEVKLEITAVDLELNTPVLPTDFLLTVRDSPEGEILVLERIKTDSLGRVTFGLEPGLDYTLVSESDEYFNKTIQFTAPDTQENLTVSQRIELSKIPDEEIVIPNIYYPFDKAYLTPEAQIAIDTSIYEILVENPFIVVEISSHTDSKGSDKYNQHLSQRRAQSVVNYLLSKGIDKKRLRAKGYGESQPIAPNTNKDGSDNPTGRAKNRRTGFRVIGKLDVDIYYEY